MLLTMLNVPNVQSELVLYVMIFQAANPGCILEDFVRWYSPPDWTDNEASTEDSDVFDSGEPLSTRGQLSQRMQKEGVFLVFSIVD